MISTRTVYRRLSKVLQDASKCSKWSLHSCPKVPKRCLKVPKVSQWFQGVPNRWRAQLDSLCAVKSHHHQMPGIPTNYYIFLSTQYISITIHNYRQNNTIKYTNKRIQNTKLRKKDEQMLGIPANYFIFLSARTLQQCDVDQLSGGRRPLIL